MLFDFYGPMLTQKQAACFTMRYIEDCSLTEIAKELGISPQAAVDFLKRAVERLERCEEQLGLVMKFAAKQALAQDVLEKLDEFELLVGDGGRMKALVQEIRAAIDEMILD